MNPFNLESEITAWRKELEQQHAARQESLDELEGHLRDQLARLQGIGLSEAEQFQIATGRMGEARSIKQEFAKLERERFWRWWNTSTALKVLGVWFVLCGLSGLSFMPALWMMGNAAIFPAVVCLGLCALQIMIGTGLMQRVNFWRWCAMAWAGIFLVVTLASLNPIGGMVQHFIFFHFHFPDSFLAQIEHLSRWQLVFSTRFADFRHVTDFLSPAILIWGVWFLTRRDVREKFERNRETQTA